MKTTLFVSAAAIAVLALGACNRETPAAESATDTGMDATATTEGGMAPADGSMSGTSAGGSTSSGAGASGASTGGTATGSGSSGTTSGGGSMSGGGSGSAVDTGGMPQGSTATAPRSSAVNEQVPGGPVAPGTPVSPPRGGVVQGPRDPATGR